MVYAGKINKDIVAKLQANQCNAIGFSGADGNAIVSIKRPIKTIDYGFVGDVVKVNTETLNILLKNNVTPVFCAITHDEHGQLLNTNADTIASELAIGFANLYKTELYYCFEKNGVLKNVNDDNSVIQHIDSKNYQDLIDQNIIADGMLPKLNNCFHAIHKNVQKVCIGKPEMLFNKNTNFTTITQ
jgi:acetylglutamate kinase